ncbi:hypothetical protein LLG96_12175 [bacterium]|nr:hypothetical protein [bacterium]
MNSISDISRRDFIARGTAAAAGTLLAARDGWPSRTGAAPSARPFVTGVPGKKLVGCYSSASDIIKNPKYIDALQKKLGVNVLICGEAIKMPDWLKSLNPLGPDRYMHAGQTEDDSQLIQAIEETHRRGMDFWLYFSGHHYGEESRAIMGETFDGVKFIDLPLIKYALAHSEYTACFEKPAVKAWEQALFGFAAKTYDVDSMYVSHYRYATPSFWSNLFGCGCSSCQQAAGEMGYDFGLMRDSMMKLRARLERLDRKTLEQAAKYNLTFMDFISFLGEDNGVMDWLYFRAKVVGNALKRIHDVIHTETNHRSGFVTDTHGATMSLFVGHNYEDLINGASDALHPLSWAQWQFISVVAAWANQLCEWVPGLDESVALKIVTGFFGWQDIGLPDRKISDLAVAEAAPTDGTYNDQMKKFYANLGDDRLIRLMTHEWTRMAAIDSGRIPAHPVIKGYEWPEKVCRELMDRTAGLGLTGYVFQRTDVFIDREKL